MESSFVMYDLMSVYMRDGGVGRRRSKEGEKEEGEMEGEDGGGRRRSKEGEKEEGEMEGEDGGGRRRSK